MPSLEELRSGSGATAAPKCTLCEKSVYKAEELKALDRVWHKSCFTCGAGKDNGCKKSLSIMAGYAEHVEDGMTYPFCQGCYNKNYAPHLTNASLGTSANLHSDAQNTTET